MNFKRKIKLGIAMVTGTLVVGLLVTPSVNQLCHHDGQVVRQSTAVTVKALTNPTKTTAAIQPKLAVKSTTKTNYSVSKTASTQQCPSVALTTISSQRPQSAPIKPVSATVVTQARPTQFQRRAQVVVAVARVTDQPAKLGPAVKN